MLSSSILIPELYAENSFFRNELSNKIFKHNNSIVHAFHIVSNSFKEDPKLDDFDNETKSLIKTIKRVEPTFKKRIVIYEDAINSLTHGRHYYLEPELPVLADKMVLFYTRLLKAEYYISSVNSWLRPHIYFNFQYITVINTLFLLNRCNVNCIELFENLLSIFLKEQPSDKNLAYHYEIVRCLENMNEVKKALDKGLAILNIPLEVLLKDEFPNQQQKVSFYRLSQLCLKLCAQNEEHALKGIQVSEIVRKSDLQPLSNFYFHLISCYRNLNDSKSLFSLYYELKAKNSVFSLYRSFIIAGEKIRRKTIDEYYNALANLALSLEFEVSDIEEFVSTDEAIESLKHFIKLRGETNESELVSQVNILANKSNIASFDKFFETILEDTRKSESKIDLNTNLAILSYLKSQGNENALLQKIVDLTENEEDILSHKYLLTLCKYYFYESNHGEYEARKIAYNILSTVDRKLISKDDAIFLSKCLLTGNIMKNKARIPRDIKKLVYDLLYKHPEVEIEDIKVNHPWLYKKLFFLQRRPAHHLFSKVRK